MTLLTSVRRCYWGNPGLVALLFVQLIHQVEIQLIGDQRDTYIATYARYDVVVPGCKQDIWTLVIGDVVEDADP
jgi:hypothetical protein